MSPSIRERIGELLLGTELKQYRGAINRLKEAYMQGPYVHSPEQLASELKEYDSAVLQDVITSLQWDLIGNMTEGYGEISAERTRAVDESRRLWRRDVVTAWIIQTWTNFGFGENIQITPTDPKAQDKMDKDTGELEEEGVWTEFWEADRNQSVLADDVLHRLSDQVLIDGEFYFVYYISTLDGKVTVRIFETKQVTEIITDPSDDTKPLFYHRTWQDKKFGTKELYYPDYMAYISGDLDNLPEDTLPKGAKRADQEKSNTIVMVQHVAHNRKYDLHGWPLMTAGAAWSRAHKRFREDRASVASLVAMTVNKLKVKGGSRAVDAMKSKMDNVPHYDPSSIAGGTDWVPNAPGTFVQNQATDLERMPLSTAAGDASVDGNSLLLMAGLGGGLFPHWLGAGEAFRLATATAMETPLLREFDRYQRFWASHFRRMVRIVLWADEHHGLEEVEEGKKKYKTYTAQVSTDRLVETDIPQLATSIGIMVQQALIPTASVMPAEVTKHVLQAIWRQLLQAMGVEDAVDITSDEIFKIGEPGEPQPLGYNAGAAAANAQSAAAGGPPAPIPGKEGVEKAPKAPPVKGGPPTAPPQPSGGMRVVEMGQYGVLMPAEPTAPPTNGNGNNAVLEKLYQLKEYLEGLKGEEEDDELKQTININVPKPPVYVMGQDGQLKEVDARPDTPPVINVNVPEQKPPVVNVTVPEPVVNIENKEPKVTIIQPDQAPVVNVPAPVVNVSVPTQETVAETQAGPKVKKVTEKQVVTRDSVTREITGSTSESTYEYEEEQNV